jgi:tripartite-type tricarboxylate transporter receptor subunit TctC
MKVNKLTIRNSVLGGVAAMALAAAVSAQTYPTKSVRLVVSAAPGGANDILGRIYAKQLSESLGKPFVIDNRAGATGNIGSEIVAHAPPDGHTILYCTASVVIAPSLYPKLGYQLRELAPLSQVSKFPLVVVVHPTVPVTTIAELIAFAKKSGGNLAYGTTGAGSMNHLTGVLLNNVAGIETVHVPYKGGGPLMNAVLSNEIPMAIPTLFSAIPHVRSGKVRALAVSSLKPMAVLPGVPALASTFPGFETTQWHGYFTTAGTPAPVVALLGAEIVKALRTPVLREAVESNGGEVVGTTPQEFAAVIKQDSEKFAKLVKMSGAKAD